jgi:serine/threonine-protein kinase
VWVDGFVVQRFPVTNREYVAFLDDLVDQGRVQDALRFAPSERRSEDDTSDRAIIYGRRADGHFELVEDADGDLWGWDWPVLMLDWVGVHAYLEWLSERTGQAWRLPWELEWEKMARGTDARTYPWGDFIDPSWACTIESHADRPLVTDVDQYPVDESPYGIRGLGGGVYDLCGDRYEADGPSLSEGRFQPVTITRGQESSELVVVRGGCWTRAENHARSAGRGRSRALERNPLWCFRPVRSL